MSECNPEGIVDKECGDYGDCVNADQKFICICDQYRKPGYSEIPAKADVTVCALSDCWEEGMIHECTNKFAGVCSKAERPACTCSVLTKGVYCNECKADNASIEVGCLCNMGYVLRKVGEVYNCVKSSCISDSVIVAIPECANLYNTTFVKTGIFTFTEYDILLEKCVCGKAGTCSIEEQCTCKGTNELVVD